VILTRHVFYVEGYDPQGAEGYYGIFQYAAKRFRNVWPARLDIEPLTLDDDLTAHWDVRMSGEGWRTETRYEFLRLEHALRANMARPIAEQIWRALRWALNDHATGTTRRIFRAAWRFGFHMLYFQFMLLAWLGISALGGALAGWIAAQVFDPPMAASLAIACAAALALFALLRPLARRWFVIQINNCWPHVREFANGEPSTLNAPLDAFAQRIVAAARANDADEILVVGHSGGGVFAPSVMARALALDPDLGRHGAPVILMTLGSIMPAAALHPKAHPLRAAVERIAVEESVTWIDCQSRTDWLNFHGFDPIAGLGIDAGERRRNPSIWTVRFRDMLTPKSVARLQWNLFRKHYQFIMGNELRAPYDYCMLTCGPVPAAAWRDRGWDIVKAFRDDGGYDEAAGTPANAPSSENAETMPSPRRAHSSTATGPATSMQ
jgi:hypothetical protein